MWPQTQLLVHWGRYAHPDDQNFVENLLPSTTLLSNWKFLRKSLFYEFLPFLTTFFNSFQLLSLFPDLFFQIVWEFFFRFSRLFFFEFIEPDPLIARIKGLKNMYIFKILNFKYQNFKNWILSKKNLYFIEFLNFLKLDFQKSIFRNLKIIKNVQM